MRHVLINKEVVAEIRHDWKHNFLKLYFDCLNVTDFSTLFQYRIAAQLGRTGAWDVMLQTVHLFFIAYEISQDCSLINSIFFCLLCSAHLVTHTAVFFNSHDSCSYLVLWTQIRTNVITLGQTRASALN